MIAISTHIRVIGFSTKKNILKQSTNYMLEYDTQIWFNIKYGPPLHKRCMSSSPNKGPNTGFVQQSMGGIANTFTLPHLMATDSWE